MLNLVEIKDWKELFNQVIRGNCQEGMRLLPDKSVDTIICDLPYGTTACSWDEIIPLDLLWAEYKRVLKESGNIVLFGSQPFTSKLIMSNLPMFKYEIIWEKEKPSNFLAVKTQIAKQHENILVFYRNRVGGVTYNPQMWQCEDRFIDKRKNMNSTQLKTSDTVLTGKTIFALRKKDDGARYPTSVLQFKRDKTSYHPTQKPIELLRYLVQTYSNPNDIILDNCMGSWTTAVACRDLNRRFIGFELEKKYCEVGEERLRQQNLF